MLKVFYWYKN